MNIDHDYIKKDSEEEKVFCGKNQVHKDEKKNFVNSVFSSVATKYDLMNNLMSFGMHHLWKNTFISLMKKKIIFKKNPKILDLASGSGDIPTKFLKKYFLNKFMGQSFSEKSDGSPIITLSDINQDMLEIGKTRIIDENLLQFCNFAIEDMTNLSFDDESFDLCTVSFGIRNASSIDQSLKEVFRILKPFSYFLCMEFSPQANNQCIQKIYDIYSEKFIPFIGEKVAHDRTSYQYLIESIKTFPNKFEFKKKLLDAGFQNVEFLSLNFGIVSIFIAQKLENS